MTTNPEVKLPELPSSDVTVKHYSGFGQQQIVSFVGAFSADKMREYGTLCYEAGLAAGRRPKATEPPELPKSTHYTYLTDDWRADEILPLYTASEMRAYGEECRERGRSDELDNQEKLASYIETLKAELATLKQSLAQAAQEQKAVARLEKTCVGAKIFINDIEMPSWSIGTMFDGQKQSVVDRINAAQQPAQEMRPTDDELWDQTLRERDHYQEMADKLAEAIASHFGAEIGEHSNVNCPWEEALEVITQHPTQAAVPDITVMVNRFLGWELPKTFSPDCGISFDGRKDDEWNKNKTWPVGTNLLTAIEARAMFKHALAEFPQAPFQNRVQPWILECFGSEIAGDKKERNHRFFEESTELVQACGMTASEAHQLVDYVYGRPVGEPVQETGGVMVTLGALCLANGMDMHQAAEIELARIWTKVEQIRAKQAAKPKHSPLPISNPDTPLEDAYE